MTTPLALDELIGAHLVGANRPVEEAIFGTADPGRMASMVSVAAQDQLGVPVTGGAFYFASSGCVIGLHLADGRTVVMKAYQPRWEATFLLGVQRTQRALAQRGYPCAMPLAGPSSIGHGQATVESHLPDPGQSGPVDPRFLEVSANALADLVNTVRDISPDGLELHPLRDVPGQLYPTPHSPIFDFDTTSEGAEWIDDLARSALALRESTTDLAPVIGHLDWSANNVRLGGSGVRAVYDWDSVALASEAVVAGQAAATWRSTGETADTDAPDAAEIGAFIGAFASANGRPFSPHETATARASAVWVMAYTARCEHALEARTEWIRTRGRNWLRTQASRLL
jgi:hypothetical protein